MTFLAANIDRAIVNTQFDLRGFAHALNFRSNSNKTFSFIPENFLAYVVGLDVGSPTDDSYVRMDERSYDECIIMLDRLATHCSDQQKEAIQLIVKDIIIKSEERREKVARGEEEPCVYLYPLEEDNQWGMVVVSLMEAFDVSLEEFKNIFFEEDEVLVIKKPAYVAALDVIEKSLKLSEEVHHSVDKARCEGAIFASAEILKTAPIPDDDLEETILRIQELKKELTIGSTEREILNNIKGL